MCMSVGMWREGEGEDEREREKEQGTDHANVKLYKDRLSRSKTHRVGSQNRKIAGMLEPLAQMETCFQAVKKIMSMMELYSHTSQRYDPQVEIVLNPREISGLLLCSFNEFN